jgi:AraC-like DNA-binding protein
MLLSSAVPEIRSASLAEFSTVAASLGLDARAMVTAIGLPIRCLSDPDLRIPAIAVQTLLEEAAARANVDDVGIRLAEKNGLSTLGPLGLLMREQPTLRDAIAALNQYHDLHTSALSVRIEDESDIAIIKPVLDVGGIEVKRQVNELALGALYRIVRVLLGDSRKPHSVCLMRSVPVNRDVYRRVFDTQVQFDADFDGIVCNTTMLDAPMPRTDPIMARYVKSYVESIASSRSTSASRKVRELLYVMIPSGRCSAAEVAKELGVDRRTLHRHLIREGETFSRILTSTRIEMAKRLLENRDRPLTSVAEMLGFSALSAFMRWFRTHFGCTATAWRLANGTLMLPG